MNIFQWNFFNKFAWIVFSGILPRPGVLFTILTHILSETSCMLWHKALKLHQLQVHIGIFGCRQFKTRGPDFAGKQRVFFIALTYHCTLIPQQTISKFVRRFPGLNPHCRNTFRFQNTRLIALASTVTMFINSIHICLCQKEKKIICK